MELCTRRTSRDVSLVSGARAHCPAAWPEFRPAETGLAAAPAAVESLPLACCNEMAAVTFIEKNRWGERPACVHCGSEAVYQMSDVKTGGRSRRFLWRCRDCKKQFTVRIGTVFEDSRLELRHWCYAFWRASTSTDGVAAPEIMRQCQISYKSALFLLQRVRYAMAPAKGGMFGIYQSASTKRLPLPPYLPENDLPWNAPWRRRSPSPPPPSPSLRSVAPPPRR